MLVTDELPLEERHGWKYIAFGPDGMLYVPLGAPCNICEATVHGNFEFSAVHVVDPLTGDFIATVARGVRNTVGFDWHPVTGDFWFTENGADRMGDNLPDCELNRLSAASLSAAKASGASPFYGFPFCHTDATELGDPCLRGVGGGSQIPDGGLNDGQATMDCSSGGVVQPVQALGPHVAPLGMRFYQRNASAPSAFPPFWDNAALIAERGSWNRASKIGYRVVAVSLDNTYSTAFRHEVFLSGFRDGQTTLGRPVDVMQLHDGSLLVSDDTFGCVYRVAYRSVPAPVPAPTLAPASMPASIGVGQAGNLEDGNGRAQANDVEEGEGVREDEACSSDASAATVSSGRGCYLAAIAGLFSGRSIVFPHICA